MFLKNKNIIFKIRRSKVTDYAALNDRTDNIFVTNLIEASKRISKKIVKKQPVTLDMIKALCTRYATSNDLILEVRDMCMILLGFSGFLRFDELSSFRCYDISIFDSYFILKIRKSKTDQYQFGDEIPISIGASIACP